MRVVIWDESTPRTDQKSRFSRIHKPVVAPKPSDIKLPQS
ncbi:hypothetical protein B6N60_03461 [Richelia sinica FACHB-800]|uniref:Uncharacterized protein n=1 Tax=Richelia sinica FACHB-800 TaxID=1357546 RepID=A0A975T9M3_9NOST|nr:hypothetical protein B6N60_03461 [Richelia sinica FACHB-800]